MVHFSMPCQPVCDEHSFFGKVDQNFNQKFSFPFNFRTANALVLKSGTLPLSGLFSNILLAILDI